MAPDRPDKIVASSGRIFATFPAAVVVPIVNKREELLLLESQRRPGLWEPVNGAVEEGETLLEAALREVREEAGAALRVHPLGVVHASTFAYDDRVRQMISVVYLMAHKGGVPEPGVTCVAVASAGPLSTRSSRTDFPSSRRSISAGCCDAQWASPGPGSENPPSCFKDPCPPADAARAFARTKLRSTRPLDRVGTSRSRASRRRTVAGGDRAARPAGRAHDPPRSRTLRSV